MFASYFKKSLLVDEAIKKITAIEVHNEMKGTLADVHQKYFDIKAALLTALKLYCKWNQFPKHKENARKLICELEKTQAHEAIAKIIEDAYHDLEEIKYPEAFGVVKKSGRFSAIVIESARKIFPLSRLCYEKGKPEEKDFFSRVRR